jgi:hypothetical protein
VKEMENRSEEKSYSNLDHSENDNYQIFESYDGLEDCRLNTYNRVRYFAGQLIVPEDLTHNQNYFNSKRHLINKIVNGTGVVCGLGLQITDQSAEQVIRIDSGLAIDCCGREIVVENGKNISLKLSQSSYGKTVKRLGLFLIRREFLKSPVPVNTTESHSKAQLSESRIEESYDLILKPIETSPVKIEFDKASYNLDDKVRVELWDPDNLAKNVKEDSKQQRRENGDTIRVDISSGKTKTKISLNKLRKVDVYQGEINLTTKNGGSKQNTLEVSDSDDIKATFSDDIFATAHITRSSDSFILDEKRTIANYYNKKLLKGYQEQNPACKALHLNNQEHGVLLAILKGKDDEKDQQRLYIDRLETEMYKEVVYNNLLLYDFVGEINNSRQEVRKQPAQCVVLSGHHRITADTIKSLKENHYLITDPINIFEKYPYSNKSLQFPPIIHLGRAPYKDPDKSIMGFENIDYAVLKTLYRSKEEDSRVLGNEMDLDQLEAISCRPLAITINSFRLAIIRNPVKFQEIGDSTRALILRWWAVCQFKD